MRVGSLEMGLPLACTVVTLLFFRKDDQASAWSKHGWCLRAERDFLAPSQRDKPVMFSPKLVLSGLYFGYTSAVKAWLTVSLDMFGVSLV